MNITIDNGTADISLPSEEEMKEAVKICCGRCCHECETPVEYAWRKRMLDLAGLTGRAVEEVLSEAEKAYIKAYYYEGRSTGEIAGEKGVSRSVVCAALTRAKEKLRRALGYAVIYQNSLEGGAQTEAFTEYALHIIGARHCRSEDVGTRLKELRSARAVNTSAAAKALGIGIERLLDIEAGRVEPLAREVLGLCEVYGVIN